MTAELTFDELTSPATPGAEEHVVEESTWDPQVIPLLADQDGIVLAAKACECYLPCADPPNCGCGYGQVCVQLYQSGPAWCGTCYQY